MLSLHVKFVTDGQTDRRTNSCTMEKQYVHDISMWAHNYILDSLFFWLKVLTSQFLFITQTTMKTPLSKIDDEINSSPNDNISDWFKLKQEDHDGPRVSHLSLLDCEVQH